MHLADGQDFVGWSDHCSDPFNSSAALRTLQTHAAVVRRDVLEEICRARGYARITNREDAPLAEVLGVLARECITGHPSPPAAQNMLDLWRPFLGPEVMKDLAGLKDVAADQARFAESVREMLTHLDIDFQPDEDLPEDGEDEPQERG